MTLSPKEATDLILKGRAPAGLETGVLDLSVKDGPRPLTLPEGLRCFSLSLAGRAIQQLPPGLSVEYRLDLSNCGQLTELPEGLKVSTLVLTNCVALAALPAGLETNFLQLDGCTSLEKWPDDAQVTCGWVRARDCRSLPHLPKRLGPLASLDLRGCRRLESVSAGVEVRSWIDIGDTRINSLPESLKKVGLRWRGVPVTARIAFFPETFSGEEILGEPNAEVRRVMMERVGFERFLGEVKPEVLHADRDRGGERRLLRIQLANDEPIVLVSLHCPSTGRHYLVRVPPDKRTCHEAVAWTAGFDNPDEYQPLEET